MQGDGVQEVVFVVDVAVQGHHPAVERAGEGGHAERVEAVGIGEVQGGGDDVVAGEGAAAPAGLDGGRHPA
jgi:hypothetical protein